MFLGAILKLGGDIAKKVFKKGTIVGNLIGATGKKGVSPLQKSATTQPTTTPAKSGFWNTISGGISFGGNKILQTVLGLVAMFLVIGGIVLIALGRKRKRRR